MIHFGLLQLVSAPLGYAWCGADIVCLCLYLGLGMGIHWVLSRLALKRTRRDIRLALINTERAAYLLTQQHREMALHQIQALEQVLQKEKNAWYGLSQAQVRKIYHQETELEKWSGEIEEFERLLQAKANKLQRMEQDIQDLALQLQLQRQRHQATLLRLAGCNLEGIKQALFQNLQKELDQEADIYFKRITHIATEDAERKAKKVVSSAIHRCNFGHWFSPHLVPYDISRGELCKHQLITNLFMQDSAYLNIFAERLGVTISVNPVSHTITISTGDGVLREIIRRVVEMFHHQEELSLLKISQAIDYQQRLMDQEIIEAGRDAMKLLAIRNVPRDLLVLLGRLKYRSSFGQNVLWHSVEVAYIAGLLAAEIGLDPYLAKRTGLFHDIGKAVDHEKEGGHPELGREILLAYGEPPAVIEGVVGHHEDVRSDQPYATLINAADAISASRPGARRETFEKYIRRLEKLEAIAYAVAGVENAYAISAGRELRVMVDPTRINDEQTRALAKEIAQSIEEELNYPGKVKVTLVRETKVVEYAR